MVFSNTVWVVYGAVRITQVFLIICCFHPLLRKFRMTVWPGRSIKHLILGVLLPEHGTDPQVFYEGLDEAMAETRGRRVP